MTTHASGTFEVKMTPQPASRGHGGKFSLDKKLARSRRDQQRRDARLATAVPGSAGYVAMEQ